MSPDGTPAGDGHHVPTPFDYDSDPGRYRLGMRLSRSFATAGLYAAISEVLLDTGARLVLDIGCGNGPLRAALPDQGPPWLVGLDASRRMLLDHPPPVVLADAVALPLADRSFDAVVAVNTLDHLHDPRVALREARRVLAAGGLLVAAAISRDDAPELAPVWRPCRSPFDAEDAPALVASVFGEVEVRRWDAPLVTLPDPQAVRDFLVARFIDPLAAADAARDVRTPLTVTKRGAMVLARAGY
jgi:SAM-dependent methyltransferase